MLLEELLARLTFANPKSRILAWPRLVTKMFAGLMSRWTIPSACAASSASAISMASERINFGFQRTPGDAVLQRHAVEILHGDEVLTFALVNLEDHADVGMIQCRSSLCFALETGQSLRVLGDFIGQEFQGDEAMQLHVLGFVDHAHTAAAQLLNNAVVGDGLADHV